MFSFGRRELDLMALKRSREEEREKGEAQFFSRYPRYHLYDFAQHLKRQSAPR